MRRSRPDADAWRSERDPTQIDPAPAPPLRERSSQWDSANSVSGGGAPPAFKGFAGIPAGPTTCGGRFNASPGNSTPPPDSVPSFTPMLVTSSVIKNGNTIMGTKPSIVVVQTNPGYGPAPGHEGTAQVVAVLCP